MIQLKLPWNLNKITLLINALFTIKTKRTTKYALLQHSARNICFISMPADQADVYLIISSVNIYQESMKIQTPRLCCLISDYTTACQNYSVQYSMRKKFASIFIIGGIFRCIKYKQCTLYNKNKKGNKICSFRTRLERTIFFLCQPFRRMYISLFLPLPFIKKA